MKPGREVVNNSSYSFYLMIKKVEGEVTGTIINKEVFLSMLITLGP